MTLSHDITGSGPAVLLLHSTVCDRRMWDPQVPALAEAGFRVVRCDLPAFGESPVPDGPFDVAGMVLELVPEERFAVVGSSGGGRFGTEIAARWPERVSELVLLCAAMAGYEPGPRLREFAEREEALLEAGDVEAAVELNVVTFLGPDADEQTRERVRVMQRHNFEVQLAVEQEPEQLRPPYDLGSVTARTTVVSGALDLPDFHDIARELTARIAGATHVPLAWAGHLPSLERPTEINRRLLGLLSGRRG